MVRKITGIDQLARSVIERLGQLEEVHLAQAKNYLEVYEMEVGLLINFGSRSLQFKRAHNNRLLSEP